MKDLLLAIKARLQSEIASVNDRDVYVTESLHLVRRAGSYPALGLKDAGTSYALETSINETDTLTVKIGVYVRLMKQEAGIIGDAATNQPGVLDLASEVKAALKDNTLGDLVESAIPVSVSESSTLATDNLTIQMVSVTMKYTRYE